MDGQIVINLYNVILFGYHYPNEIDYKKYI